MRDFVTHTFWLAKGGNAPHEYEDAFLEGAGFVGSPARALFAVADGATEGLLSGMFANLLVKRFVRHWDKPETLSDWLSKTLHAWELEKREYLRRRERSENPVQWYEEPGLEAGAFAALVGLELVRADSGALRWQALAVGDSCIFQVRDNDLVCAFPIYQAGDFTSRPFLLSSNPARNDGIVERFQFAEGELKTKDRFYLVTDALAAWFLRAYERGEAPWREFDSLCGQERRRRFAPANLLRRPSRPARRFADWVEGQRAAHTMRNDDVTLVRVELLS